MEFVCHQQQPRYADKTGSTAEGSATYKHGAASCFLYYVTDVHQRYSSTDWRIVQRNSTTANILHCIALETLCIKLNRSQNNRL